MNVDMRLLFSTDSPAWDREKKCGNDILRIVYIKLLLFPSFNLVGSIYEKSLKKETEVEDTALKYQQHCAPFSHSLSLNAPFKIDTTQKKYP